MTPLQPNEHKDEILNALEYYYLEVKKLDITIGEAESMAEAKLLAYIESERADARDSQRKIIIERINNLPLAYVTHKDLRDIVNNLHWKEKDADEQRKRLGK